MSGRHLTLKVDVDTLRGTLEGVPGLLDLLARHAFHATFLFSLGPDHTGRALKRALRPGFFAKVQRTSVVEHYGVRTLLYGTLLPGPDIGARGADVMRSVAAAGHEVGIHTWDHTSWQDNVRTRSARWTWHQMTHAYDRFVSTFGGPPATHGAAGWQMNDDALRQLETWKLAYASDGRVADDETDRGAFRPLVGGRALDCVQIPTTLPTLDELIGIDGCGASGAADLLLARDGGPRRRRGVHVARRTRRNEADRRVRTADRRLEDPGLRARNAARGACPPRSRGAAATTLALGLDRRTQR